MTSYDSEETNTSKYNEASMKMNRINEIQRTINSVNLNLLAFNHEVGRYNYEVYLSSTYSLMMEVLPKLKQKEQDKLLEFYNKVYRYVNAKPIYKSKKVRDGGSVTSRTPDMKNFELIRNMLVKYEALIRLLLEKHGLGTPGMDTAGL